MSGYNTIDSSDIDYEELLNKISKLQDLEQSLVDKLDKSTTTIGYAGNQDDLIKQIKNVSDSRIAMFKVIQKMYRGVQQNVSNSRVDLVHQLTLVNVVEDQLSKAKESINKLQNQNDTKMRLVEINTYYGKRYEAHIELMKLIIFLCVPVLILLVLKNRSILPEALANLLVGIVIAVGAFFIIRNLWDLFTRSNMNYDEYDWKYENPAANTPSIWEYNKKNLLNIENPLKNLMDNLGICIGERCCATGQTFDNKKQKCVVGYGGGGGGGGGGSTFGSMFGSMFDITSIDMSGAPVIYDTNKLLKSRGNNKCVNYTDASGLLLADCSANLLDQNWNIYYTSIYTTDLSRVHLYHIKNSQNKCITDISGAGLSVSADCDINKSTHNSHWNLLKTDDDYYYTLQNYATKQCVGIDSSQNTIKPVSCTSTSNILNWSFVLGNTNVPNLYDTEYKFVNIQKKLRSKNAAQLGGNAKACMYYNTDASGILLMDCDDNILGNYGKWKFVNKYSDPTGNKDNNTYNIKNNDNKCVNDISGTGLKMLPTCDASANWSILKNDTNYYAFKNTSTQQCLGVDIINNNVKSLPCGSNPGTNNILNWSFLDISGGST